jgi:hypothetical protein
MAEKFNWDFEALDRGMDGRFNGQGCSKESNSKFEALETWGVKFLF